MWLKLKDVIIDDVISVDKVNLKENHYFSRTK